MNTRRRELLKALGIGGAVAAHLPATWTKPVVESVVLPAHAQTTGSETNESSCPPPGSCAEPEGANPRIFDSVGTFDFIVPDDVCSISIVAVGADGGNGGNSGASATGGVGGQGATATASSVRVTPCETLTICVGGSGTDGESNGTGGSSSGSSACGFGGGEGGRSPVVGGGGGSGGGASVVLRAANVLLVAGGGGGGGGSFQLTDPLDGGAGEGGCGSGGAADNQGEDGASAYSSPNLPPIPRQSCHAFHGKAATDSSETCHPVAG